MCELAIVKKGEVSQEQLLELAKTLYEEQGTALGILSVEWVEDYDGNKKFNYEAFRSTEPTPREIGEFIDETWDDTIRYIVHGRLATSGERDVTGAHPIEIDCPECDVDYVLHNGVIGDITREKQHQEDDGHEWTTHVDSEVIAHDFGGVPDSNGVAKEIAEETGHSYQPAFILCNQDRILYYTRPNSYYQITDDGQMVCSYRDAVDYEYNNISRFLFRADADSDETTREVREVAV